MSDGAQILCSKCGSATATPRLDCAKCGGRNVRVCGGCGNQNSVAKNFCDQCGQSIAELSETAPPPKTSLPGSPAADIPATVIKHLSPPADSPIPAAGKSAASAPLDDLWSAPVASGPARETIPRQKVSPWRAGTHLIAALIGIGGAYGIWNYFEGLKPEILVPRLASRYLESLHARDFDAAYGMFSAAAKRSCSAEEFRASRDATSWTWSDLRIEHQEPGALLLSYDLKVGDAPARRDHVLFTLEDGRWTRPYNWTLMRQVEEAFDKGAPDKGLFLAQQAAEINPRDPMAWGYLCEAAYYRKAPEDAELRCAKALDLARTYPSNLTMKSLYHLNAILADTYHHALRRPDRALEQYAQMLAFPDISPADQCSILLARAQAYIEISRPGEALSDLTRGEQLCAAAQDQAFIRKTREALGAPEPQ